MVMTARIADTENTAAERQVSEGYKLTEVGVIPEDWNCCIFTDITTLITCGLAATPKYVSAARGYPFLSSTNIKGGRVLWSNYKYISEDLHKRLHKNNPPKRGDILYSRVGTIGEAAVIEEDFEFSIYVSLTLIKPSKAINQYYLKHLLNSKPYKRRAQDQVYLGGGVGNLNVDVVRNYPIVFPPTTAEQEAIAGALSDVDALISLLETLIIKKLHIKQGAMQELLTGKARLPGFVGEWRERTFDEIFNFHPTATNSRSDLSVEGDAYYIHYGDIHTKFHSHLNFKLQSPHMIDRHLCKNAALLQNGDWVMADASEDYDGIGKAIEISGLEDGITAVAGLHTFLLREKAKTFEPGFKGHLGNLKSLHDQMLHVATGLKVYGVSKTALKDLTLPVPKPVEQTAIAAILSDMDAEIAALEEKLSKTRQLKQGMTTELLTGRIRLV